MIPRPVPTRLIEQSFEVHPVTALLGPRQCGKTTLARAIAEIVPSTVFDLENPVDLQRLSAPMQALGALSGRVIIDEVQRKPELFELLRVLVDRPGTEAQFLLLGPASPNVVKGSPNLLPEESGSLISLDSPCGKSADSIVNSYGSGAVFPDPTWQSPIPAAGSGVKISSAHSWSGTSLNWGFPSRQRRSAVSGPWLPTTTGRCGTPRNSPGRSGSRRTRRADISISWPGPTWFGCCRPGSKT